MKGLVVFTGIAILAVVGGWLATAGEDDPWTEEASLRGITHESRSLTLPDGEAVTVIRGVVAVPEVRSKRDTRDIEIGYAAIPGTADAADIPIFLLAGGPGGSHIRNLDRRWVKERIALFRQLGDVVLVDLRGIHSSTPRFELSGVDETWRRIRTEADWLQLLRDSGAAGRAQLEAEGFDLEGYVVTEAAADVIAVADHLGYERINLQGTSFGSHFTFAVVRLFPERVNRFMVTGVEGYDHTFDDGAAVRAAVARIAAETERTWAGAHGARDPLDAFDAFITQSAADPASTFGFQPHELKIAQLNGDLLGFDYGLSHRDGMRTWPSDTAQLLDGAGSWRIQLLRWFAGLAMGREASEAAVGLFDCASWISDERAQKLRQNAPPNFPNNLQTMEAICAGWDVAPLPAPFQLGEVSQVPGLFVHGTYDVSTPYENAVEMMPLFPNGTLVTVTGGSHDVFDEVLELRQEFASALIDWFRGGEPPADVQLPPLEFTPLAQ
ncbi:MAG: alpha/beta fold hydrolase [Pseudomonadota bacterium]